MAVDGCANNAHDSKDGNLYQRYGMQQSTVGS
jgi:hypothetical protein